MTQFSFEKGVKRLFDGLVNSPQRRVLVIDGHYPNPTRDSGSLDAINYIGWFRRLGYGVDFLALQGTGEWRRARHAWMAGARIVPASRLADPARFTHEAANEYDVLFLTRVHQGGAWSEALAAAGPAVQIFNTVDLHHLRERRHAELQGDAAALEAAEATRAKELDLVARAKITIVVSEYEAGLLRSACPEATVWTMPLYREIARDVPGFEARRGLGMVAGFAHPPNCDALVFFLDEVWPELRRRAPEMSFSVAGMGLPPEIRNRLPDGVSYAGHVKDLDKWLRGLRLTVAPLRFGSGAKGKVVSSLAAGVPVVGTPVAFEGMSLPESAYEVAENGSDLADRILRVHDDPEAWAGMSAAGHAYTRQNVSVEAGLERFRAYMIGAGLAR